MKTTPLFVGDAAGLRDWTKPKGYAGRTGVKAEPDPAFVSELIRRRSALKLSAIAFGRMTDLSPAYISMIENGSRVPSEEAKQHIRETLDLLESV